MSAQFTPGPWHAAMKFAKTWHVGVYDANGTEVAHVAVKSALHGVRRKADARLMAASHDMLEALREARVMLVARYGDPEELPNDNVSDRKALAVFAKVDAAIARATGSAL